MLQRTAVCSGHAHHVAESREDYALVLRNGKPVVDPSHGKHAYRAAGAVNQLYIRRQQVFKAEAVDGVSVAAAHFHEPIMPARIVEPAYFLGRLADNLRVAKLVNESHWALSD